MRMYKASLSNGCTHIHRQNIWYTQNIFQQYIIVRALQFDTFENTYGSTNAQTNIHIFNNGIRKNKNNYEDV